MSKVLVTLLIVSSFVGASQFEHKYTREDCEVIQICDKCVTFEDRMGETWDWYDEENQFSIGDKADLKMHDNYTSAYNYDDVIKKVEKK